MVTIIFESHATTLDNETNLSSGHYDAPLSELGRRQAEELGQRYTNENFDAIFCSDLQRSYKTAEIAFAQRNFLIVKDPRLRECDYGDLTRHHSNQIETLKEDYITKPFPNGESYTQVASKIKDFLKELTRNYNGKKVMIIGHRATQYALECWIKKVPLREIVITPWSWQPGWIYYLNKID